MARMAVAAAAATMMISIVATEARGHGAADESIGSRSQGYPPPRFSFRSPRSTDISKLNAKAGIPPFPGTPSDYSGLDYDRVNRRWTYRGQTWDGRRWRWPSQDEPSELD